MNIYSIQSFYKSGSIHLRESAMGALTAQQRKIIIVVSLALSFITAAILYYKYCFKAHKKDHVIEDQKITAKVLPIIENKTGDTDTEAPLEEEETTETEPVVEVEDKTNRKPPAEDKKITDTKKHVLVEEKKTDLAPPVEDKKTKEDKKTEVKASSVKEDEKLTAKPPAEEEKTIDKTPLVEDMKLVDKQPAVPSYIARIMVTPSHFDPRSGNVQELPVTDADERVICWQDADGKPLTMPAKDILIPIQLRNIVDRTEISVEEAFDSATISVNQKKNTPVIQWLKSDIIWIPASLIENKKPGEGLNLTYKGKPIYLELSFHGPLEAPFPQHFPLSVLIDHVRKAVHFSSYPKGLFTLSDSHLGRSAFELSKSAFGYTFPDGVKDYDAIALKVPFLPHSAFFGGLFPFSSKSDVSARTFFADGKWVILVDCPRAIEDQSAIFVDGNALIFSLPTYSQQDLFAQRDDKDLTSKFAIATEEIRNSALNTTLKQMGDYHYGELEKLCKILRQKIELQDTFDWPSTGISKVTALNVLDVFTALLNEATLIDDFAKPYFDFTQLLDLLKSRGIDEKDVSVKEDLYWIHHYLKPFTKDSGWDEKRGHDEAKFHNSSLAKRLMKHVNLMALEIPPECLAHTKELTVQLNQGQLLVSIPMDPTPVTEEPSSDENKDDLYAK